MNFIEQDSRSSLPSSGYDDARDANYFAFFDKPTPENLAANHSGILSTPQQKAIEGMIANQKHMTLIFGVMSILSIFFLCFLVWKIDSSDGSISFTVQAINAAVAILMFGIFMNALMDDWSLFFAGDDVANGVVESAPGKIEWGRTRYEIRTENRLLRSLRASRPALPPPGAYRFYYLPRTGLVVMAEELGKHHEHHAPALLQALAGANSFSLEDLKVNQEGLLSKRQENKLLLLILMDLAIGLTSAVLFAVFIPQVLRATSSIGLLLLFVIGGVILLRFGWSALKLIADLWHGRVESMEGPLTRQYRRAKYSISYYYVYDRYRFQVSAAGYHALVEGRSYRVFYAPRSKQLVAIEPV
jgi:hypothetical protein